MTEIVVRTNSSLPEGEFENLLNEIASINLENKLRAITPSRQKAPGVTWEEFIMIWVLGKGVETLASEIVKLCIAWTQRRFEKEKPAVRPKVVRIYGPDGKIVSAIRMDHISGEIEDQTEMYKDQPPYLPPADKS